MDKLDKIFELQQSFDQRIIKERKLEDIPMDKWLQMETLAMVSELAELLAEVNFKWWKNPKPIDANNVKDEIVDVLHFFIAMCLRSGMDADELFSRYCNKNKENHARQDGTSDKKGYKIDNA